MRRHINYFLYVIRHKWYVLLASWYIGAPMWKALIHDMSKFLPSEWGPYARTFYNSDGSKRYNETEEFNRAWAKHQHRNSHHWQHWLLRMDRGDIVALQMPDGDVYEMVADWMGAGRAITGKWEVYEWFTSNRDKMTLHPNTMALATKVVNEAYSWYHNE